jgi:hypothetical protein
VCEQHWISQWYWARDARDELVVGHGRLGAVQLRNELWGAIELGSEQLGNEQLGAKQLRDEQFGRNEQLGDG